MATALAFQFAENARLHYWPTAMQKQQLCSNIFGMRTPEIMPRIRFVDTFKVLFRAKKALSSLSESVPNTQPFMDVL